MKILCVIDNLGSGGAQRQIVELALGFNENGNHVEFLTYYPNPFFINTLQQAGILITCIEEPNYIKRLFKMRHFIRKGNYNAVLSFLEGANFICEFAGLPFRKWSLVVGERSANPDIMRSLRLKFYRWFHVFADFVVANSYTNMKMVQKINPFLSKTKCKVIYNIVDTKKWNRGDNAFKKKNGTLNIVVAARHQYLKNLKGLAEALAMLPLEVRSKIKVDWYGHRLEEPYVDGSIVEGRKKIEELELNETLVLYDTTDSLNKKIQEADAVGLFSYYEGFPNVVCEGMACAKPIICTEVSDVPYFLEHEKELLCVAEKPDSIQKAISNLYNLTDEEKLEIGLENEKIANEKFNKELIVSHYLELLKGNRKKS